MTDFNHGAFMRALRAAYGPVPQRLYDALMPALEAGLGEPRPEAKGDEPAWLVEARKHMGTKEVSGAKHNPKILGWIKELGGWFTDDETPWCGTFSAICMKTAGHVVPQHWYRAKDWMNWGRSCEPRLGAVAVFGRSGGGHVGFVVGESRTNYYVLGGNQKNAVNIMPIAKTRLLGFRWPKGEKVSTVPLPAMSGGTVSRNEQ